MEIDFRNIIIKDIDGKENTVDISKELATILYNISVSTEALDKAKQLKETGKMEVNTDMKDVIKQVVTNNFYAVVQIAVNELLDKIEQNTVEEVVDEVVE